ncbi:MAG: class I SAM-dependent methyltransferase [Spirosomataceae bacterium]
MIGNTIEYEKMYAAERELWWYKILHRKVLRAVRRHFPGQTISILDAGCGTGGLLSFLKTNNYHHTVGLDGSEDAVAFCRERQLDVTLCRFESLETFRPENRYDVIICNDVFYCLEEEHIPRAMRYFREHLKPNGLLITNNNAFDAFYGTHDVAVGGKRRFVLKDLEKMAKSADFQVIYATYWSFFLSPLILAVRRWQAFKLRRGWEKKENIVSDVALPSPPVNQALFYLVKTEEHLLPKSPFGSSLFTLMRPCSS